MLNKILSLSKQFISIESIFDNHKALNNILELALDNLDEYTIERFESNGVKSVLIFNCSKRPNKFKIILNGHLDVVPGKDTLYKPTIAKNKLFGVGSLDMKASVACLIIAFKKVANQVNYPLALQLTTDEEVGGFNGTKHQIDMGVKSDFILAGEPTNLNIVNRAKGFINLKVSSIGKAAHGAYVWKGVNAIFKMNAFLNVLRNKFPTPLSEQWATTLNLCKIETSNSSFNKVPDNCTVWLQFRCIPDERKKVLHTVQNLLPDNFKLEVVDNEPPFFVKDNNIYIKKLQKIVKKYTKSTPIIRGAQGTSDIRHFSQAGQSGVEFGPIGKNIGSDNEFVSITSLNTYYNILVDFLFSVEDLH